MTRSRANPDGTPGDLAAEYYAQRASAGLLIREGTQPSDDGQGYLATPGIYTDAHVAGWRKVTSAVHDTGGRFFIQLMHVGRVSHPDNTPHHRQPVAPSAIAPGAQMFTQKGMVEIPEPRALSTGEIHETVEDFRISARRAIEAGADGVEIHGANGYLVHQFLAPSANTRADQYGGGIENRVRFAIEVATAIAQEIGAERAAIRLSPGVPMNGIDEGAEGPDLYRHQVGELNKLDLTYLHILHIGNESLLADMEAYGQFILANPDFGTRLKAGAALNEGDRNTFFAGGGKGYFDYPVLTTAGGAADALSRRLPERTDYDRVSKDRPLD